MSIRIPAVSLRPAIEAARNDWQARLNALIERDHYILGEEVAGFEQEFAQATGARHAIGCGNGTQALELCLREAGVTDPKADVITSALTAPFTAVGLRAAGPRVVFADVDPDTLLLDPGDVENRLTRRVKAIVPVHLYGQVCEMDRFRRLARGRVLVQDAAQAHGARYGAKPLTAYSDYVAYSFYPTKNLGALGDGGGVATDRKRTAARLRCLRDGGRRGGQVSHLTGINSRLDEMQACFLRAFLPFLGEWNRQRARIAGYYDEALSDVAGVRPVKRGSWTVNHLYVIRAARRDRLRAYLGSKGIGTGVHYPSAMHLHPAFLDNGLKKGDLPVAERACREVTSLPMWPLMPMEFAEQAADGVRSFYR